MSPRRPVDAWSAVRRQMRLLHTARIDLVHLHEEGWNYDLLVAAALRRIPVVLHVHNPVDALRNNVNWPIASRVVFVSEAHRTSTGFLSRIEAKTTVIYNAVDIGRFASGSPIREKLGVSTRDFVIGTVAQVSSRKGIDLILDAAASLIPRYPDIVFLVAGPPARGEVRYVEDMRARAAERSLGGRVRLIGPRSDVPDFLASCDLFFLPTRAEPMGIAVVEAMAAGLPVVASRVGGVPEVVISPEFGTLVAPLTGEAFAAAIEEVMLRPDAGRGMGSGGRDSARERFDRSVIATRWNELYGGLRGRRPSGR